MGTYEMAMTTVLLACLTMIGCAAPITGPWYVSSEFSQAEEQQIAMAARSWEVATLDGEHVDLVFGADVQPSLGSAWGRRIIAKASIAQWEKSDLEIFEPAPGVTMLNPQYQAVVLCVECLGPYLQLREVAMHEMGHTFGMCPFGHHLPNPEALMSTAPSLDADRFVTEQCVSNADADELLRVDEYVKRVRRCL